MGKQTYLIIERSSFAVREHLDGSTLVVAAGLAQGREVAQEGRPLTIIEHQCVETSVLGQWSLHVTATEAHCQSS